jgi:hypothetical protein
MFKFLLYAGFIFFLIYWFLILPFKPSIDRERQAQTQKKRTREGNLNIDRSPDKDKKSSSKGYDGGDYVDYEEVK